MKRTTKNGIVWTYRPGFVYAGTYCGWNINIRHTPPLLGTGLSWRLHVTKNGGGSIAFGHQFYRTIEEARTAAIRFVDEYPSTRQTATK